MGIGTCSMCERSNLTELNFFEIKRLQKEQEHTYCQVHQFPGDNNITTVQRKCLLIVISEYRYFTDKAIK